MKNERQRILVSMPTTNYAERMKLEGLLAYAHERKGGHWDILLDNAGFGRRDVDGVVAYIVSEKMRREIVASRHPAVLVEDLLPLPDARPTRSGRVATIVVDHEAEGRTAARYFLERHFSNFAFVGATPDTEWSRRRFAGYVGELKAAGFRCSAYRPAADKDDETRRMAEWLKFLPKPCALFAIHDIRARQVLSAAAAAAVSVPFELAVLGVDDDRVICTTSDPALSSIPTFDRSLGYAAGRFLAKLLDGCTAKRIILTRHTQVTTRFSTGTDAIADPVLARLLRHIRGNLAGDLGADALSKFTCRPKHSLQLLFSKVIGTPMAEVVRRIRLSSAAQLLANTDMPVVEIAESCGFANTSHLCLRFREIYGETPYAYRRSNKV